MRARVLDRDAFASERILPFYFQNFRRRREMSARAAICAHEIRDDYRLPRPRGSSDLSVASCAMGVTQRRGASVSDGAARGGKAARRAANASEFSAVKRIAQVFLLLVFLVFAVAGVLYARGATKAAELKAEELRLEMLAREAARASPAEGTDDGELVDMAKGATMLKKLHGAGLRLITSIRDDGQLAELDKFWASLEEGERQSMWDASRETMLSDPSLASLLEGEGARVTDALVPEMYADHFAREPERLMRLTRLILAGEENGPGGAVGTAEGTDIGHKEARALYRSAILSRFVTTFLIDLLNHMAAAAGYEGA